MKLKMRQGDISSAYLYAKLKEPTYSNLLTGHPKNINDELCYESFAAVYGLPDAAQAWERHFKRFLKSKNFKESQNAPGIYWRVIGDDILYIIIYVDDFLYSCRLVITFDIFEAELNVEFTIKFTNQIEKFVGIQIEENENSLNLSPTKMIEELCSEYNLFETPMVANLIWNANSAKLLDIKKIQKLIGELSYIKSMYSSRHCICS